MANNKAYHKKRKRRRRIYRKISDVLSMCAIIVLLIGILYLTNEIYGYWHNEKLANELRTKYYSFASNAVAKKLNETSEIFNSLKVVDNVSSSDPIQMTDNYSKTVTVHSSPSVRTDDSETTSLTVNENVEWTDTSTGDAEETILEQTSDEPEFQEQFIDLYHRNDDLVGWLYVNENINYPFVWREGDNDFYMNHDFDKNSNHSGWIFLDKRNSMFMDDDHLLIYGHNMRLGNMFGELDRYRNLNYVKKNPIIEIQSIWQAEPKKYVIISVFDASMNEKHSSYVDIANFNFETPEEKQKYIKDMYRRSFFKLPCETTADDQLITLVTCSYTAPNGRFLLVARQLREDETTEQIMQMFSELKQ